MSANQDREWTVAKSNEIIRNTRYSLSVQQQKMLLFMISKIKPSDIGNETYTFSIQDFCAAAGLDMTNGFYYTTLKKQIKELRDSSVWVKVGKKEILLAWLNTVEIDSGSGTISFKFHESVQPYLFELKEKYTSYKLKEVLTMRSKYALRLYEIAKSYAYGREFDNFQEVEAAFTPKELITLLDAVTYDRYYNFKQRVLKPAIKEINEMSEEIHIEMEEKKTGRAITEIYLLISLARTRQRLDARQTKAEIFNRSKKK